MGEVEVFVGRRLTIEVEPATVLEHQRRPHAVREPPEEFPFLEDVERRLNALGC